MKNNPVDRKAFYKEVYQVVGEIPSGRVTTYGEIALLLGKPQYSRMVGSALKNVPDDIDIPCHRVVNSNGRLVPGWYEQKSLLAEEGVQFKPNGNVDMNKYQWNWREV